ncbi:hypothetical protein EVAR_85361_1 [Eumeta japonica]|uniref:Uncharacterized protein n=1 Tax=Eumeta variegata TaxID=151549 RepID=A0A4C1WRP6_EUMVA|nr:hypothetical protein EVAR_85361_1 [Eumeta japonica]
MNILAITIPVLFFIASLRSTKVCESPEVIATLGHVQFQRSHQCVAGLSGKNRISNGEGNGLKEAEMGYWRRVIGGGDVDGVAGVRHNSDITDEEMETDEDDRDVISEDFSDASDED